MKEILKDIPEYEGVYQVSNLGNVKNINYRNTKKERKIKCHINKNGYVHVVLTKNKISLKGFEKIWYQMNWKNVKEDK